MDETPTSANVEIYLDILVEQSKLLRLKKPGIQHGELRIS